MNKLAQINNAKELLAAEYLQKQAQLEELIKQAAAEEQYAAVELQKQAALVQLLQQSGYGAHLEAMRKGAAAEQIVKQALFGYNIKEDDDTDYATGALGGGVLGGVQGAGTGGLAMAGLQALGKHPGALEALGPELSNVLGSIKGKNIAAVAAALGLLGAGSGAMGNVMGTATGDALGLG